MQRRRRQGVRDAQVGKLGLSDFTFRKAPAGAGLIWNRIGPVDSSGTSAAGACSSRSLACPGHLALERSACRLALRSKPLAFRFLRLAIRFALGVLTSAFLFLQSASFLSCCLSFCLQSEAFRFALRFLPLPLFFSGFDGSQALGLFLRLQASLFGLARLLFGFALLGQLGFLLLALGRQASGLLLALALLLLELALLARLLLLALAFALFLFQFALFACLLSFAFALFLGFRPEPLLLGLLLFALLEQALLFALLEQALLFALLGLLLFLAFAFALLLLLFELALLPCARLSLFLLGLLSLFFSQKALFCLLPLAVLGLCLRLLGCARGRGPFRLGLARGRGASG